MEKYKLELKVENWNRVINSLYDDRDPDGSLDLQDFQLNLRSQLNRCVAQKKTDSSETIIVEPDQISLDLTDKNNESA